MNIIEINNVTHRYWRTEALRNLTLNVPTGSVFALLGANGAGKTTAIKMMMNLLRPTTGVVRVLGKDSSRLGEQELAQIGYVSENQQLPLWMTVRQLLDYCRPFYPTWDAALETRLLAQFDLPPDRKLKQLSRGMLMKVALLSSLAYRPKLLVLDEPFSGLDPLVRDEFIQGLLEAAELGDWTDAVNQTWSWTTGMKLTRSSSFYWWHNSSGNAVLRQTYSLPVLEDDPETVRWIKVRQERTTARLNASRVARGLPAWPSFFVVPDPSENDGALLHGQVKLPNSYLAKMQVEPPAYRADAHWKLYRPEVVAELPLKDDARASGRGQTLHLQRVNGDKPLIIGTRSSVTLFGLWFAAAVAQESGSWFWSERFAAVNRVTGDIMELRDGQMGSQLMQVGGVTVTWNVLPISPRMAIRDDKDMPADPQWREHTILVLLADTDVAWFDRAVETAKFELEPAAPDKNP